MCELSELRFGMVHGVGRGITVLDRGPRRARGRGGFESFVPRFHNGNSYWVADDELSPVCMRKRDNISVQKMYRWKSIFVGFLRIYSVSGS